MIALIQRVTKACVRIDDVTVGAIDAGVLALVAAEQHDEESNARRLAERVLSYRIFPDRQNRMNLSATTAHKAVLAVPQFTLAADTRRGNRPGFSHACPPGRAEPLFSAFVNALQIGLERVETGRFGADMQVTLVNDGPVTFWLNS